MIYPNAKRMGLPWLLRVALLVSVMEPHVTEMD